MYTGGLDKSVPTQFATIFEEIIKLQQRRSPRLKGYDYSQPGAYFVTICIQDRSKMFGDVANNVMCLSPAGEITQAVWDSLPERFPHVSLDVYVVMPNHFHGIVVISDAKLNNTTRHQPALGEIIRTFKALTTHYVRVAGTPKFRWQQKYWDTIIRNEYQLDFIRHYIVNNPTKWTLDKLYA